MTTVVSGQTITVSAGQTSTNDVVLSGGTEIVLSGGTASGTTVNSGGLIVVSSGSTVSAPSINSGGAIKVVSGATLMADVIAPVYAAGAIIEFDSGTHPNGFIAGSGRVVEALSGANMSNTFVSSGTLMVFGGATVTSTTVQTSGFEYVSSGGTASGTVVSALGTLMLFGGATATAIDVHLNGLVEAVSGYTLNNFVVSNSGVEAVGPGGFDSGTVVQNGGTQLSISGGVATSATIQSGGVQSVSFNGSAVATTIQSGGSAYVRSGGTVSGTTVNAGGYLGVSVDGSFASASGTIVSGGLEEVGDHGSASGTVVSSGGFQQVDLGGLAAGTTVFGGGTQGVTNGTAWNTTLRGGSQTITAGAIASRTVISSGGSMTVGATASGLSPSISSGGHLIVSSGGWIVNPSVFGGGTLELAAGAITSDSTILSFNLTTPAGKTLIIHGTSMPGATTQITNVFAGDVIDLTDAVFAPGGTVQILTGNKLEVVESGVTFDLQLGGHDYSSVTFNVGADSGTGTKVFVDRAPTTTTANITGIHGHGVLPGFSVSDPDGEAMTKYALWDTEGNGHWTVNGAIQATNAEIDITPAQLAQTQYVFGATASDTLYIRAFDGAMWSIWSKFTATPTNQLPVVSASNVTPAHGVTSMTAASLFSATDADGDTITQYSLWDTEGNGHWVVNGTPQATNAEIDISPAQLGQTSYVFGSGTASDTLYVRASDGIGGGLWQKFIATPGPNALPVVTAPNFTAAHNQTTIAPGSLFSVSDADNDTITTYALWDSEGNGHWVVGGNQQATHAEIDISAAQLGTTTFVVGSAPDTLSVRAFDGLAWSAWANFTVTPGPNHTPVVTAFNFAAVSGESVAAASLFTATDADNDTITTYALWDSGGNGHWVVNGQAKSAGVEIDITAAQLSQTSYVAGPAGTTDTLYVRANDGNAWGQWTPGFTVAVRPTPTAHAPVVSVHNPTVAPGQSVDMATLVTASDPDGGSIVTYAFWASGSNGHFQFNLADQPSGQEIDVTATQFSHNRISYVAGTGSDQLWIRVNNGTTWSDWVSFTGGQATPVVTASNVAIKAGTQVNASTLFTAVDPDIGGGGITTYALWDSNGNGHFTVNGSPQGAGTEIDLTATQLGQTTYTAGSSTDQLWVRANNGVGWSAWQGFTAGPATPRVTVATAAIAATHSVAAASLFTAVDPNIGGGGITTYALWDSNGNGHFSVNSSLQSAGTEIDLTPTQLGQTTYTAGSSADQLWVRANNGVGWSDWQSFTAGPAVPTVTAANLTTAAGQVFAAANLFAAVDPNIAGGGITTYAFWDSNTNGHFTVNNVQKSAGTEIDLTPVQLAQTTYTAGTGADQLWIRANNGVGWSVWVPFTATGSSPAIVNAGATLELASAFSNQVTFFDNTGTLKIDDVTTFHGTVAGLAGNDALDLVNIVFANLHTPQYTGDASGGTLSVTDGTNTATIAMLGNYQSTTFVPSNDGHGGTRIV